MWKIICFTLAVYCMWHSLIMQSKVTVLLSEGKKCNKAYIECKAQNQSLKVPKANFDTININYLNAVIRVDSVMIKVQDIVQENDSLKIELKKCKK